MIVGDRLAIYRAIETVLRNELAGWGANALSDDTDEFVIERFEEAVIHRIVDAVLASRTET